MKNLKTAVRNLEKETDRKKQIEILQSINKLLLTGYEIKVGDFIIEPLLVEAYYYCPGKFEDTNTHGFKSEKCRSGQSGRFGKLYVHKMGYGGIDICLSMREDYCLSFLIKNSLVSKEGAAEENKKFCTQVSLLRYLKENLDGADIIEQKGVLCEKNKEAAPVINTVRKGVNGSFKNDELASLPVDSLKDYPLTLEKGYTKEKITENYLKTYYADSSPDVWKKVSEEILGYSLNKVIREHFGI